jgi:hypothetical protein
MSSKQQFREALKGDKKIIADLKKENERLKATITRMHNRIVDYQWEKENKVSTKKWYQFWK